MVKVTKKNNLNKQKVIVIAMSNKSKIRKLLPHLNLIMINKKKTSNNLPQGQIVKKTKKKKNKKVQQVVVQKVVTK